MPAEVRDFELMGGERIAWSWRDMQDTPSYVQRFCLDLLAIKRRCMKEAADRQGNGGGVR